MEQLKIESLTLENDIGTLLRIKEISSRFQKKRHTVFLKISSPVIDTTPEDFAEISGYCTCKSGSRTIGGCVHVVTSLILILKAINGEMIEKSKSQASFEYVEDVTPFKKTRMEERKTANAVRNNELQFGIESHSIESDSE